MTVGCFRWFVLASLNPRSKIPKNGSVYSRGWKFIPVLILVWSGGVKRTFLWTIMERWNPLFVSCYYNYMDTYKSIQVPPPDRRCIFVIYFIVILCRIWLEWWQQTWLMEALPLHDAIVYVWTTRRPYCVKQQPNEQTNNKAASESLLIRIIWKMRLYYFHTKSI